MWCDFYLIRKGFITLLDELIDSLVASRYQSRRMLRKFYCYSRACCRRTDVFFSLPCKPQSFFIHFSSFFFQCRSHPPHSMFRSSRFIGAFNGKKAEFFDFSEGFFFVDGWEGVKYKKNKSGTYKNSHLTQQHKQIEFLRLLNVWCCKNSLWRVLLVWDRSLSLWCLQQECFSTNH